MQRTDFSCTVGYDVDVPCVFMTWKGYATTPLFREANARVLACLAEHRATRLLGDVADFVLIAAEDQDWLNTEWIPRAVAAGLRPRARPVAGPTLALLEGGIDGLARSAVDMAPSLQRPALVDGAGRRVKTRPGHPEACRPRSIASSTSRSAWGP
ncbi:MAG: hypothetical protein M5U07_22660 [Xanthobacteraceae bacterium]|nr:hypothetical protein [Xanthobacteraceae bacterium]